MSSLKATVGSIFNTVSSTAVALTNLVGTANEGVNMLNNYVETASKKQVLEQKVDLHTHRNILIEESAMKQAERRIKIAEYSKKSEEHSNFMKAGIDEFSTLLS